ncbi:MAG: hypothetical protein LAN84_05785 [Acidobacteriia bacterium]|nr:hypothetical protein [Terriglobia bacterium]
MPRLALIILAGLGASLFLVAPCSRAHAQVSGRYQCVGAKVRGKAVPCKSRPLLLTEDGRYEIHGREGSYVVIGEWLVLADRKERPRAKIAPGHRILFQFPCGKGTCEMTFQRRTATLGKTFLS